VLAVRIELIEDLPVVVGLFGLRCVEWVFAGGVFNVLIAYERIDEIL
jgi:hypothetical protein